MSRVSQVASFVVVCMLALVAGSSAQASNRLRPRPAPTPTRTTPPAASGCAFSVVPSPNASTFDNTLFDVSVLSPTDAWAVGQKTVADGWRTLVLHWDGTAWRIVSSPNRLTTAGSGAINSLSGVTAIAPNDVWAVGYTVSNDDPYRTLAMHWNGSAWKIVGTPDPGSPYNALNDVAAVGPNDVWAVGGAPYLGTSPAPIESAGGYTLHWDGRTWAAVPPPADRANNSVRAGVATVSSSQVWAVGQFDPWVWNGTQWTVPTLGAQGARGVDAAGSTSVWAVGSYDSYSEGGSYGPFPIGYRWTGSAWAQYPAAAFGAGQFLDVAVRAASDVLAVGYVGRSTLAARWNGSGWQRVPAGNANPAPNTNRSDGNVLLGVDSAPGGATWAVGYYYNGSGSGTDYGVQRTLVERLGC